MKAVAQGLLAASVMFVGSCRVTPVTFTGPVLTMSMVMGMVPAEGVPVLVLLVSTTWRVPSFKVSRVWAALVVPTAVVAPTLRSTLFALMSL